MKALRVASGLTQEELARQLDVSVSTVRNWDVGRTFPSLGPAGMLKLIEVLGIDLPTLIDCERAYRGES